MLLRRFVNSVKLWRLMLEVDNRFSAVRATVDAAGPGPGAASSSDLADVGAEISLRPLDVTARALGWGAVEEGVIKPANCGWLCVL